MHNTTCQCLLSVTLATLAELDSFGDCQHNNIDFSDYDQQRSFPLSSQLSNWSNLTLAKFTEYYLLRMTIQVLIKLEVLSVILAQSFIMLLWTSESFCSPIKLKTCWSLIIIISTYQQKPVTNMPDKIIWWFACVSA